MDCDISDDREAKAIASLMDINQLVSKRSSRKGYITRVERFLSSIQHLPPQAVDAIELERKFTELSRHIRLYEKLQVRYEELIDPSEKVPESEQLQTEAAHLAHENLLRSFNQRITHGKLGLEALAITDLLEDFEAEDDITACIEDIQKLRIRVDAFKGTAMVGTDDSLKSSATDFRHTHTSVQSKDKYHNLSFITCCYGYSCSFSSHSSKA